MTVKFQVQTSMYIFISIFHSLYAFLLSKVSSAPDLGEVELEHFSHPHSLIFKEDGEGFVCSGCKEPNSGPCYSCAYCNFFLHKKCSELPLQINSHVHPEHPLFLLARPPPEYAKRCRCDICWKACKSFVYHCSLCKFDLDIKCAVPPCLFEVDSQEHQFKCLLPSLPLRSGTPFTCNACGADGDDSPYVCTMCLIMVHRKCMRLPRTIKIEIFHHHSQFQHTYFVGPGEPGKQFCGICREEVKVGMGGYNCRHCELVTHVNCALDCRGEVKRKEEEEVGTGVNDELMEPAAYTVREIKQGTEIVIVEIKHFSHPHNLILVEEVKDDLKCDGCMIPISSPCYGCTDCNFFLDKSCIKLPRQMKLYDRHPITLFSKASAADGVFECSACEQYCHGFVYKSPENGDFMDVRCFQSLKDCMIEHESHEHRLFLAMEEDDRHCTACGIAIDEGIPFKCINCIFNLDIRCANLPRKVWHEYDNHPLFLTYNDPNTYQFYCLICEKERDPKLWFYRCEVCDFDAHPDCALGKYAYIKFGGTYTCHSHSHLLTLVENIEENQACHICGKPCNDFLFKCTDSGCDFVAHRDCIFNDLKSDEE